MSDARFYKVERKYLEKIIGLDLGINGKLIKKTEGACGEIYIFDLGENTIPRYVCAKVPKMSQGISEREAAQRFVRELRLQLSFYGHVFVHWAYDLVEVLGAPAAKFRYYGSDLRKYEAEGSGSDIGKLSIMAYVCSGLDHCYDAGLVAHQDLKPLIYFYVISVRTSRICRI